MGAPAASPRRGDLLRLFDFGRSVLIFYQHLKRLMDLINSVRLAPRISRAMGPRPEVVARFDGLLIDLLILLLGVLILCPNINCLWRCFDSLGRFDLVRIL